MVSNILREKLSEKKQKQMKACQSNSRDFEEVRHEFSVMDTPVKEFILEGADVHGRKGKRL